MTARTAKWRRDPDAAGERYASWSLVSADGETLADVVPVWAGTARGSDAPTGWRATVGHGLVGEFNGVNAAKAAIRAVRESPRAPAPSPRPSPGPFGGPLAGARRRAY